MTPQATAGEISRNLCLIVGGSNLGIVLTQAWEGPAWWYLLGAALGACCIAIGWRKTPPGASPCSFEGEV